MPNVWAGRIIAACAGFLLGCALGLPPGEEPAAALCVLAAVAACGLWYAFERAPGCGS
jgi:hypothetical protein